MTIDERGSHHKKVIDDRWNKLYKKCTCKPNCKMDVIELKVSKSESLYNIHYNIVSLCVYPFCVSTISYEDINTEIQSGKMEM